MYSTNVQDTKKINLSFKCEAKTLHHSKPLPAPPPPKKGKKK